MNQQDDNSLMYSNYVMGDNKERVMSAVKELVNSDDIVENIRFQLTGTKKYKVQKPDGTIMFQVLKYHEPLMNDYGVNKVLTDVRGYIQSNVILGYLKEDEIKRRSKAYFTNIVFELSRNMLNYGIYSKENHAKIRGILSTNFHTVLSRAYNGLTILTALKNINVVEQRDMNKEDKQGKFGVFNR